MTLLAIMLSMIAGIVLAYTGVLPASWSETFSELPFYCLCVVLAVVGYGIGKDKEALRTLLKGNRYCILVPLGTVIGTIVGGFVAGIALNMAVRESMAVAGGFGWYTYSAVYLTEAHSPDLGAIAFLSNVSREVLAIFAMPLVIRIAGRYSAVSMGGATTMDVTLPIIIKYAGSQAGVVAFIHGVILSVLVPILLPVILG